MSASWIEGLAVGGVVAWVPLSHVVKLEMSPTSRLDDKVVEKLDGGWVVLATLDSGEEVWLGRFPTLEEAAHFVRTRLPAWPQQKPV